MRHLLFVVVSWGFVCAAAPAQPNILLIVADDLGYSDLGCFGGEISTPNLDQLASNGVRLTQFHTTSRCCPSRASLLTGHYPHLVGLGHMTKNVGQPGYRGQIASHAPTIAQVLGLNGYQSFISGKWHLGTADPTQHGFDQFYGTLVSAKTFWDPDHFARLPQGQPTIEYRDNEFYGTDAVTDHALQFLNRAKTERPWFLYLAYNAPHFPLQAPQDEIRKYQNNYLSGWDVARQARLQRMKKLGIVSQETQLSPRSPYWNYGQTQTGVNPSWDSLTPDRRADLARRMAIYAAMVDRMDHNIGRVVEQLRSNSQLERTLILFLSDNGACAEWDPRGFDGKSSNNNILHRNDTQDLMGSKGTFHSAGSGWANASNTPWRLYKHYCHQGGLLSPCIVHWPDRLAEYKGQLNKSPAHLIDVMPTSMAAASTQSMPLEYPAKWNGQTTHTLKGTSILDLLAGRAKKDRKLFFEHEGNRAVRHGQWKLVALKDQPWELFNLHLDPTELNNIARQHGDRVEELAEAWDDWAVANQVVPFPQDYGVDYLKGSSSQ